MFEVQLGLYSGPRNKISKEMTDVKTYNCQSTSYINVKNPQIKISTIDNLSNVNYAYIPNFSRYYFVTSRTISVNGMWILQLSEDVLKTYENQLKTTKAAFNRSSDFYNTYLPDSQAPITSRQVVTNKIFPSSPFDNKLAEHGAIVTIAGASQP